MSFDYYATLFTGVVCKRPYSDYTDKFVEDDEGNYKFHGYEVVLHESDTMPIGFKVGRLDPRFDGRDPIEVSESLKACYMNYGELDNLVELCKEAGFEVIHQGTFLFSECH